MLSCRLPVSAVEAMAGLDSLRLLARGAYAMTNVGDTTTQGDAAIKSDVARTNFGLDGSGVIVGVLSDSYNCLGGAASDVVSNDLPSGVNVLQEISSCPASDEGRAMMQLVHDVAPGTPLAFHSAFNGMADFANGIQELATIANAKVIVDDVTYFAEPMFQDGIVAQAVDTVRNKGSAYFSSAGNSTRRSYESAFVSSGTLPFTGDPSSIAHDFDPGSGIDVFQRVTIPQGTSLSISFQWDQPFASVTGGAGSANDVDIYLFPNPTPTLPTNPASTALAGSASGNVNGDPVEVFQYVNPSGSGVTSFNIMSTHYSGPPAGRMKYIIFRNVTINEYATNSSTVFGHHNADGT